MRPVLLRMLSVGRCHCFARVVALTALTLGVLSAHGAGLPGPNYIEGRHSAQSRNTVHSSLSRAVDLDARQLATTDSRQTAPWRSLDGAGAAELRKATSEHRDRPVDPDRFLMGTQVRPLTGQWTRSPNWVQTLGNVRRQGIPLLRPSSSPGMVVSLGLSRHGTPGIYVVQQIAP